jgi:hypothetical protein
MIFEGRAACSWILGSSPRMTTFVVLHMAMEAVFPTSIEQEPENIFLEGVQDQLVRLTV